MPITEADMTYEEMQAIVRNPRYHCGECGGSLTVAWGGGLGYDGYVLRCGTDIKHSTITKYNRKEEEYMQEAKDQSAISSLALMKMSETEMVERVTKSKFVKDLTPPEKARLAIGCITYGLDPIMGELTIYQGNPFVTVDGRYRKAQETGQFDGVSCRPATKEERAEWEIPTGDKFFRAEVYRKDAKYPFVGWGRVTEKEMKAANAFTPIATNPQRMCEKRAEVQGLRKAFSIPLPSAEFIDTPEERAETIIKVEGVGDVSTKTGEIKEDESDALVRAMVVEVDSKSEKKPSQEPAIEVEFKEVPPEPEPETTSLIDKKWLEKSLAILQAKNPTAYSEAALVGYMKSMYKGVAGETIWDIASKLDGGLAKHFQGVIEDSLKKEG